jgi:hypothetical protein
VAVGSDDDEGVRSGDRGSETGWVGDVRMLADRVVDGAEGDGGGGGSIHRGWAAELKDQVPLGDGWRLRKESLLGRPLSLVADGGEAISGGRCGFCWSSLGRLRCGLLGLGRRGWWWWWWCDVTSGKGGDVLSQSLNFHRQNGVRGRSECGSSCGSRSGSGSESSDLCSQVLDRLLQRGDNFLVLAWSRCSCGSGGTSTSSSALMRRWAMREVTRRSVNFREKSTLPRPRLSTRMLNSFPTLSGQIGDVHWMHRCTAALSQ